MSATIALTRAAYEALRQEARSQLDNSCGEYVLGMRNPDRLSGYADEHRAMILACAEVIGQDDEFELKDGGTAELELSDEGQECLRRLRRETAEHLEEIEQHGDGDRDYVAREAFLLRVLDRAVGGPTTKAVAV